MPSARSQFIDVIDYVDQSQKKQLIHKFVRESDEIKQGAKLIVRNGQAAVFVRRGKIADIFEEGNYKLSTRNLPILSTLAALPYRFNSPIKSDVYFVNTTQFINNKWGTKSPVIKRDPEMGIVRITSFGTFSFRVKDVKVFMNEIFGARSLNFTEDIIEYLSSFVGESIAQCLGEMDSSVLDLATHYRELSSMTASYVNEKSMEFGIEIPQAAIENIGLPEEVERLIDEQSGIGLASRDMDTFVQYQSARAIRDAARQSSGVAGLGAGMAAGRRVASEMDASLSEKTGQKNEKNQSAEPKAPKPEKAGISIADQLAKYKDLLDREILTQEEYDEVKEMLLKEF